MTFSRAHARPTRARAGIAGAILLCLAAGTAGLLALTHASGRTRPDGQALASRAAVRSGGPRTRPPAAPATTPTSAAPLTTTASVPTTPSSSPRPPVSPGPPYGVGDQTIVLQDPSRPTPARGSVAGTPGRVLRTIVRRPIGVTGPLPLVVFAHGYNAEPETYGPLLDAWAAAGYLVAAPECPGSARDLPGTPVPDYAAQARDVSFVITSLLGGRAGPVDPNEIAVAGHSDGGTAVTIMALNAPYTDGRVKGYINLAGQIPPDVPGPWASAPTSGALLVGVGSVDEYGNLSLSTAMFDAARMPKALLVVPGGDHMGTFVDPSPVAQAVRSATTRFLATVFAGPTRAFTPSQLGSALQGQGATPPFSVSVGD
jgi:fermentation-respiration switch protein FrsA (DUF1100 family)